MLVGVALRGISTRNMESALNLSLTDRMTIDEVRQLLLEIFLQRLGYNPIMQKRNDLWYNAPYREKGLLRSKSIRTGTCGSISGWDVAATSSPLPESLQTARIFSRRRNISLRRWREFCAATCSPTCKGAGFRTRISGGRAKNTGLQRAERLSLGARNPLRSSLSPLSVGQLPRTRKALFRHRVSERVRRLGTAQQTV